VDLPHVDASVVLRVERDVGPADEPNVIALKPQSSERSVKYFPVATSTAPPCVSGRR